MDNHKAYDFLVKDPTLEGLALKYPLKAIEVQNEPIYDTLVRSVVSQQLSIKAAETIYNRFLRLFDDSSLSLEGLLNLPLEDLRSVGLSKQKASYVQNVASFFLEKDHLVLDWTAIEDDKIVELLTSIKGVGEWTVHMLLIFNLNRQDVLPLGDLIVKQGLMNLLRVRDGSKKGMARLTKKTLKWAPYRSYVSRLMWASKDD